jgi:hypothetical protein
MQSSTISSAALGSATATTSSFETSLLSDHSHTATAWILGGKRAMKRAGVITPAKGAHVLRHTATGDAAPRRTS